MLAESFQIPIALSVAMGLMIRNAYSSVWRLPRGETAVALNNSKYLYS